MARPFQWFTRIVPNTTLAGNAQTSVDLTVNMESARRKGCTVTRMLVNVVLEAGVVAQDLQLTYGVLWVDADALSAGALPDTDVESENVDYMLRGCLFGSQSDLADSSQWTRVSHDVRGQRVCRTDQDHLVLVLDNALANSLNFRLFSRTLVRLP